MYLRPCQLLLLFWLMRIPVLVPCTTARITFCVESDFHKHQFDDINPKKIYVLLFLKKRYTVPHSIDVIQTESLLRFFLRNIHTTPCIIVFISNLNLLADLLQNLTAKPDLQHRLLSKFSQSFCSNT